MPLYGKAKKLCVYAREKAFLKFSRDIFFQEFEVFVDVSFASFNISRFCSVTMIKLYLSAGNQEKISVAATVLVFSK